MRKIIASEFMTLDGVMEAPGGEDSLGTLGGWSFLFWNEEAAQYKFDELFASGALLGRVTYQIFAASWPSMTDPKGFADRMNNLPKFVVSTSLEKADWKPSTLIKANAPEEISKLKQQPGQDLLLCGSAELVHTLRQHDLIDEYRLMVFPIILGTGKRLFQDGSKIPLRLVDTKRFSSGVVVLTYQPERHARQPNSSCSIPSVGGDANLDHAPAAHIAVFRFDHCIPAASVLTKWRTLWIENGNTARWWQPIRLRIERLPYRF